MVNEAEMVEVALPHSAGIDTLLPAQFGDLFRSTERTPEQRLMLAILEDAIHCWLGTPTALRIDPWAPSKRMRLAREADIWIFDGEASALVSFQTCCAALGIDSGWLREKLGKIAESAAADEPGRWRQGRHRTVVRSPAGDRRQILLNRKFAVEEDDRQGRLSY
jgi:hypothetical protein